MATSDPARLAELARADGRLGLDTEFMPEGRYKPLLCLVQIAAGDEIAVLDPLRGLRPRRRSPSARRPRGRDRRPRRPPGRRDPAPRVEHGRSPTSSTRRSRRASPASPRRRATTACCTTCCKVRLPKTASFTRWDARPLTEEQLRYARGDVEHLLALRRRDRRAAGGARPARVGARGVPRDRRGHRRARSRRGLAAAAARQRARRARPRGRARAGRLARAHRGRGGPAGRLGPARPDGRRARQAPARWAAASWPRSAASTRTSCAAAGRRVLEAIARGKEAEPVHLDDGDRLPTESVDGPVIALAESLVRSRAQAAGLAYELIAARADLAPIVVAARRGAARARRAHAARLAPRAGRRRAARAARRPPHARPSPTAAACRSPSP